MAAGSVRVGWIPGYSGLSGNEIAVRLVRRELDSPSNARTIHNRMTCGQYTQSTPVILDCRMPVEFVFFFLHQTLIAYAAI